MPSPSSSDEGRAQLEALLKQRLEEAGDDLPWRTEEQDPVELDLSGKRSPPDRWQPKWIREKYWR